MSLASEEQAEVESELKEEEDDEDSDPNTLVAISKEERARR